MKRQILPNFTLFQRQAQKFRPKFKQMMAVPYKIYTKIQ